MAKYEEKYRKFAKNLSDRKRSVQRTAVSGGQKETENGKQSTAAGLCVRRGICCGLLLPWICRMQKNLDLEFTPGFYDNKKREVTVQPGLCIYCTDRMKTQSLRASGPSRSDFPMAGCRNSFRWRNGCHRFCRQSGRMSRVKKRNGRQNFSRKEEETG